MQLKVLNRTTLAYLLLAVSSATANAAVFKGDACAELHAQSAEPKEAAESTQDYTLYWQLARTAYLRSLD